jgi:hypothetical protein
VGDEGRRFLRYVIPGLVYGVETLLFLYIVMPGFTVCVLAKLNDKHALGAIVGAFLVSGALGYIFAAVHHWVHWHLCFEEGIFDHRPIIKKLYAEQQYAKKRIPLNKEELTRLNNEEKEREMAESISLALWYRYMKEKDLGKEQIDLLGHQAHGLGTARIASIFAILTTVWLSVQHGTPNLCLWPIIRYVLMLCLGVGTIWMFHDAYRRVARFAQETYDKNLEYECDSHK